MRRHSSAPPEGNTRFTITYLTGGGGANLASIGAAGCSATDAYGRGWSSNRGGTKCGTGAVPTSAAQVYHFLKVTVGRARVLIRPKQGILDPQGQAVEQALPALGFRGVQNVHVGRLIELDVEDPDQLPEMCERLLANPLIEDYEVLVMEEAEAQ